MTVTCALFGPFRERVGQKNVTLSLDTPTTVRAVLDELANVEPALAEDLDEIDVTKSAVITVDGSHINHRDGFETAVEEGSIVRITPPVSGGVH